MNSTRISNGEIHHWLKARPGESLSTSPRSGLPTHTLVNDGRVDAFLSPEPGWIESLEDPRVLEFCKNGTVPEGFQRLTDENGFGNARQRLVNELARDYDLVSTRECPSYRLTHYLSGEFDAASGLIRNRDEALEVRQALLSPAPPGAARIEVTPDCATDVGLIGGQYVQIEPLPSLDGPFAEAVKELDWRGYHQPMTNLQGATARVQGSMLLSRTEGFDAQGQLQAVQSLRADRQTVKLTMELPGAGIRQTLSWPRDQDTDFLKVLEVI